MKELMLFKNWCKEHTTTALYEGIQLAIANYAMQRIQDNDGKQCHLKNKWDTCPDVANSKECFDCSSYF